MVLAVQENIKMQYSVPQTINPEIFRTYDIRGPVRDDAIHADLAYAIGLAFGAMAQAEQQTQVVVGRDGRMSGEELTQSLVAGLRLAGCDVIDIGMVSTPVLYYATHFLATRSGIMVTGSHNPAEDNGFKLVLAGNTLTTAGVQEIYQRIVTNDYKFKSQGDYSEQNILPDYTACIVNKICLQRKLKVVIDCGNGAGALTAPEIFKQLGCEVIELFCEVDGRFPNHHPDPTVLENLVDLMAAVKSEQADLGLAFDGDADRVGVITGEGEIIWPDRQMLLFSQQVCANFPGREIIFDVKCTSHLPQMIAACGGKPVMYKTGHSLIKAKMKELDAPLAGEMSGHIFFNDDWFGFDDGVYVGARLLEIIAAQDKSLAEIAAALPNSCNTPELKLPMAEGKKATFMQRLLKEADFGDADLITIDGLRVEFGDGWGLVRPSNTSAYLIIRFEAENEAQLEHIKEVFRQQLLKLESDLQLPF